MILAPKPRWFGLSLRHVAGLLCGAFAMLVASIMVLSVINRIDWHAGYSAVEDAIVFGVLALVTGASAFGCFWLNRP